MIESIYNYFKRKEKSFFKEADYVISLTESGKREINTWESLKGLTAPIEVIPCCVDLNLFDWNNITEENQTALKHKLGINEHDYILGYVGSIGTWYMLDEMLLFFKRLSARKENAKFLFVTGENPSSIIEKAENIGLDKNQIIVTSALHKDVPIHMSLFSKSIFFIRSTFSKKASSPTKQGEITAMGVPLICNAGVGDTDDVVQKYNAGLVVNSFDDKEFDRVINSDKAYDKNEIIQGAKEYFSLEQGVQSYLKVYKAMHG